MRTLRILRILKAGKINVMMENLVIPGDNYIQKVSESMVKICENYLGPWDWNVWKQRKRNKSRRQLVSRGFMPFFPCSVPVAEDLI